MRHWAVEVGRFRVPEAQGVRAHLDQLLFVALTDVAELELLAATVRGTSGTMQPRHWSFLQPWLGGSGRYILAKWSSQPSQYAYG